MLRRTFYFTVFMFLVFGLSGCAIISHGRMSKISLQQVKQIKIGESTKEDVIRILGKPQSIVYKPNDVEVYVYVHGIEQSVALSLLLISIGRGGGTGQTLSVTFDAEGVVMDYEYTRDSRGII